MFVNTPGAMAPWGGSKPVFGTNPVAFACPLPGRAPLVIDLSLSKGARGNIMTAKQRRETIPEDWAFDADGKPTTDPDAALRGTMAPMGGAKGTVLALMVELLAAGLTGSNFAQRVVLPRRQRRASGNGQLIIAFDPAAFGGGAPARFGLLAAVDRGATRRAAAGRAAVAGAREGEG